MSLTGMLVILFFSLTLIFVLYLAVMKARLGKAEAEAAEFRKKYAESEERNLQAAAKGEAADWDGQRRVYNMSPREMFAIYAETVKAWIVQIKQTPDLLSDGKIADAIAKHVSVLQKLDTRGQYLGVALDLIKVANQWLAENQPEVKTKLDPYWESIYQELVKYSSGKGLF